MAIDKTLKLEQNKWEKFSRQLLVYTAMFILAAGCAYIFFFMSGSTFLKGAESGNKDGVAQIYPSYVAVKRIVHNLLTGGGWNAWDWSIGLGGDTWNMYASKLANPFTYIIIAFPEKYIDLGYTVAALLRQYCAGLAFLLFGRKIGLTAYQNVIASICYAFSMWMLLTVTAQSGFDNAAILFPLLVLGTEKIIDKESPLLFILSVFFLFTAGVIWAYASGIMIVIYYLVRTLCKKTYKEGKEFALTTGQFLICGICGILLASAFVASILMSMTSATTDTGSGKQALFTIRAYLSIPTALFKAVQTCSPSYSCIGLPIVGVILMPFIVSGALKKQTESVMALVFLIGSQIPAVCRMFNGFAYPSGRWFFTLMFFLTWATIENLNKETFRSAKNCWIMEMWLVLMSGWCIAKYLFLNMADKKTAFTAGMGLVFGTAIIIIGYIVANKKDGDRGLKKLITKCGAVLLALIVIVDIAEIETINSFSWALEVVPGYSYIGEAYERITNSSESAVAEVQKEDDSFYRSDQVSGYFGIKQGNARINENIFFGNRSVYTCFSSAPSSWHEYNKVVGNSAGNYRRTLINSNDNRSMLDYLMGVKYFVGSNTESETFKYANKDGEYKKDTSSLYLPYGYEYYGDLNGYEVYENKYCMGLGTTYSQYITESELAEYPIIVREQVLMQTAVVADEYADKIEGVKHASKSDIKTEYSEIPSVIFTGEGLELDREAGKLNVSVEESSFYINIAQAQNCQLVVEFQNLEKEDSSYEEMCQLQYGYVPDEAEMSLAEKVNKASYSGDNSFKFTIEKDGITKAAKCEEGGIRSFNDLETFDINMGYVDSTSGNIKVVVDSPGYYTFDAIKVYAVPMDIYEENAAILDNNSYKIDEWSSDYITGTMDCTEPGIMYFSILKNDGWNIYVDGKKVDKIEDVNISFTGAKLDKGKHKVELKYEYPHRMLILVSSVFGIIMLVLILVSYRRGKRRNEVECPDKQ